MDPIVDERVHHGLLQGARAPLHPVLENLGPCNVRPVPSERQTQLLGRGQVLRLEERRQDGVVQLGCPTVIAVFSTLVIFVGV